MKHRLNTERIKSVFHLWQSVASTFLRKLLSVLCSLNEKGLAAEAAEEFFAGLLSGEDGVFIRGVGTD